MRILIALLAATLVLPALAGVTFVRQQADSSRTIVFVHGVTGDGIATWTNPVTRAYWPRLLAGDPVFNGADIAVVTLPSPVVDRAKSIDELADQMTSSLADAQVLSRRELVFVAHSMGGLVTRAFLLKNRPVALKTTFIYFFATPTNGSSLASAARYFSMNGQIAALRTMSSDDFLADQQRHWFASAEFRGIPSYCAYEEANRLGIRVVDQASATALCNSPIRAIGADHGGIVKPRDRTSEAYIALREAWRAQSPSGNTSLRATIDGLQQLQALASDPPRYQGRPVMCRSARFSLLFAHRQNGTAPLRIDTLVPHLRRLTGPGNSPTGSCKVDPLSSRPHGIVEVETMLLTAADDGLSARFIRNAASARAVSTANLLLDRDLARARAITLKPGEEPFAFNVLLDTRTRHPVELWFEVGYDEDGPRTLKTAPVVIWQ